MTKLAVIGSSHVGAVRQCQERIKAGWPGLDVSWFALPGKPFRVARCDENGVYRARPGNATEERVFRRINGGLEIDLTDADQIWVIGHRFGLGRLLTLMRHFDIAEGPRTAAKGLVSAAFFVEAMTTVIEEDCASIIDSFGADPRLIVTPAPYPAISTRARGPHHEAPLAHVLTHPARDGIFALYEKTIGKCLNKHGLRFVGQPADTRADAFATDDRFLRDARDFRDTSVVMEDMRHMNAEYGWRLFQALVELHPGLGSSISTAQEYVGGH